MVCPTTYTGNGFLERILGQIDCQAQVLGSYGWLALSEPGSLAATVTTGLLTLFIALFGLRLLFGPAPGTRDVVFDVLKIGLVLTLALSWPAFRTLIYDVVFLAPADIAGRIAATASGNFAERLQAIDGAIVQLSEFGSGRQTGAFIDTEGAGASFQGIAMQDESALGWSRLFWLTGVIGSVAFFRLAAGLLLALAPLAAGLLLFDATRGLFAGWMRGLVLALIGSVGASVLLAVEMAVLTPWLEDALRLRSLGYATPSAPTELMAMTLAFALVQLGFVWLLGKVAFMRGWISVPSFSGSEAHRSERSEWISSRSTETRFGQKSNFAERNEIVVTRTPSNERTHIRALAGPTRERADQSGGTPSIAPPRERLGDSWRRGTPRASRLTTDRSARR